MKSYLKLQFRLLQFFFILQLVNVGATDVEVKDRSEFMNWGMEVLTQTAGQKLVPSPKNVGQILIPPLKTSTGF